MLFSHIRREDKAIWKGGVLLHAGLLGLLGGACRADADLTICMVTGHLQVVHTPPAADEGRRRPPQPSGFRVEGLGFRV